MCVQKNKYTNLKRYIHPNVPHSIIYNSQDMEQPKKWMDKEGVVSICNGILLNHKKELKFSIYGNMDGFGGHYDKWNKPDRERQVLNYITYMWNLNKYNKRVNITKKQTYRYRAQTLGYQWGEGREERQ